MPVFKSRTDKWLAIDQALRHGARGLEPLPGLPYLLSKKRGARNQAHLPKLEPEKIIQWAREHHEQTGKWPSQMSGRVCGDEDETWCGINAALAAGGRGLPGGSSLAHFMEDYGLKRHLFELPRFTKDIILEWADAYYARFGAWPSLSSGQIPEAQNETWHKIDSALRQGCRGLPAGTSLAIFLESHRGRRNYQEPPSLSEEQILAWADVHLLRHGRYPVKSSRKIEGVPGESWKAVDTALRTGSRGLKPDSSLSMLLTLHRGVAPKYTEPVTTEQILAWADDHYAAHGRYPSLESGAIAAVPGRTWQQIDHALRVGKCGLPRRSSLAIFLQEHSRKRNYGNSPDLTEKQIVSWARDFFLSKGVWPNKKAGVIEGTSGETWRAISDALKNGKRGLPGGSSLAGILQDYGLK